jgi:hypothetical protein
MNADHVRDGILPAGAARNFDMQSAIKAADELRQTGTATMGKS